MLNDKSTYAWIKCTKHGILYFNNRNFQHNNLNLFTLSYWIQLCSLYIYSICIVYKIYKTNYAQVLLCLSVLQLIIRIFCSNQNINIISTDTPCFFFWSYVIGLVREEFYGRDYNTYFFFLVFGQDMKFTCCRLLILFRAVWNIRQYSTNITSNGT